VAPRLARVLAALFSSVALADALHHAEGFLHRQTKGS
jgi:hypothetical protein